jgi:hypothetical protein
MLGLLLECLMYMGLYFGQRLGQDALVTISAYARGKEKVL